MTFEKAVEFILKQEGGYVFDKADPGGETNFGISKRSYPNIDIKNLTRDEAIAIYLRDFWEPLRPIFLPPELRLPLFDSAINQGRDRAVRFLQESCGIKQDGVLGPKTFAAANVNPREALNAFMHLRLRHYANLSTWVRFGRGWTSRLLDVALFNE